MKKKLPKGKVRCVACRKVLSTQEEIREHFKSKKHLKKTEEVERRYKESLDSLTNFKGL